MPASIRSAAFGVACLMLVLTNSLKAEETQSDSPIVQAGHCEQCEQAANGSVMISDTGYAGEYGGYGHNHYCRGGRGCRQCRGPHCHYGPGHGWCPPTGTPTSRAYIEYMKWYPNYWSGNGAGDYVPYYPMVYTPTDTTQLGFYYQHAPQWRPIPGMLPAPPHPNQYHARDCQQGRGCPHCQHGYGNVVYEGSIQTASPTPVADPVSSEPSI